MSSDWVDIVPPEPRHKGKRARAWAPHPDRRVHVTRNGRGVVGRLRGQK